MDCRKLNEMFNCDGPESIEEKEYDAYIPYETISEQQSVWYYKNQERLKKKALDYRYSKRDEINLERRKKRATEPYRSRYLALQRERRRKAKVGPV